jgi:hypothetical protein
LKIRKLYSGILIVTFYYVQGQSLDDIYTKWAQREIPQSHQHITKMVERLWGDNELKSAQLVEAHCKALNHILVQVQNQTVDIDKLEMALNKWTQASEDLRVEKWWEWPDTNWIRVKTEYEKLLKEKF